MQIWQASTCRPAIRCKLLRWRRESMCVDMQGHAVNTALTTIYAEDYTLRAFFSISALAN